MFYFQYYMKCENFSKIGPIIKKILKFSDDPLKFKSSMATYPIIVTPNHWLVTQRMNMRKHALERHAAAVRQLSNGTNGDDLYIIMNSNCREHYSDS